MGPRIFASLTKVDEEKRMVYGRIAQEMVDKSDEVMDYEKSKPFFKAWSDEMSADTGGRNLGNVRAMHGKIAAGAVKMMDFNDAEKAIDVGAHIVDDNEWKKVLGGVYTGFSIGGSYVGAKSVEKIDGKDVTRYTAKPNEVSLVDRPCIPSAKFFEVQKMDGTKQQVEFQKGFPPKDDAAPADDAAPKDEANPKKPKSEEELEAEEAAGQAAGNIADEDDAEKLEPVYEVKGSDADIGDFAKILNDNNADMASVNKFLTTVLAQGTLDAALGKLQPADDFSAVLNGLTKLEPIIEASRVSAAEPTADLHAAITVLADVAKVYAEATGVALELPVTKYEGDALEALMKFGARNNKGDTERINALHKIACELGAVCEKHVPEGDLAKLDEGTLQKAVLAATTPLLERLTKLEAQPAAPTVRLRAVSKGDDFGLINEALQKQIDENLNPPAIVDAHGEKHQAAGLIKSLHRMGGAPLTKSV